MQMMKKCTALIVDDEQNGRENLQSHLQKHCLVVEVLATANSALDAIEKIQSLQPDLVFLDIEIPGANAFEVL